MDVDTASSGLLATMLDIGGVCALILIGPITSKSKLVKKPLPPLFASFGSCILSIPCIWVAYYLIENGNSENQETTKILIAVILFIIGALVNIPDPILSGVAA